MVAARIASRIASNCRRWRPAATLAFGALLGWSGSFATLSVRADSGSEPLAWLQPAKSAAKSNVKRDAAPNNAKKNAAAMTPEREAAALAFVAQQHPELDVLLTHLKSADSAEYEQAIRDISRAREKLEQSRARDERRYEIELQQWRNQSRIDLLAARIKMAPTDELRAQLRTLLEERVELKVSLLRLERDRLEERLQKTDQQLKGIAASRDSQIDNQMRAILGSSKSATTAKPNAKLTPKPNAKSNKNSKNGPRGRDGQGEDESTPPSNSTKSGNASPSSPASSSSGRDP